MGWQWAQLDHMEIICSLLQTNNHTITSSLHFLQTGCSSWRPTNSVKALKASQQCWNDINNAITPLYCTHAMAPHTHTQTFTNWDYSQWRNFVNAKLTRLVTFNIHLSVMKKQLVQHVVKMKPPYISWESAPLPWWLDIPSLDLIVEIRRTSLYSATCSYEVRPSLLAVISGIRIGPIPLWHQRWMADTHLPQR